MRIAAIYDIHGNLPALEAVLEEIRAAGVDEIVVGGDVCPGPMCRESLACLSSLNNPVRFIVGNGDRETLAVAGGAVSAEVPEEYRPAMRWVAQNLGPEHRRAIADWPASLEMPVDGIGNVLFCHATPGSDTAIFTKSTAAQPLMRVFGEVRCPLVVCGHTHMQFDRRIGALRVVNAGSVGMPFGEPGAYWLLLGPTVEFRRTDYDLRAAAHRIRHTNYPGADDFAARSILDPPTELEMLNAFRSAELR